MKSKTNQRASTWDVTAKVAWYIVLPKPIDRNQIPYHRRYWCSTGSKPGRQSASVRGTWARYSRIVGWPSPLEFCKECKVSDKRLAAADRPDGSRHAGVIDNDLHAYRGILGKQGQGTEESCLILDLVVAAIPEMVPTRLPVYQNWFNL